MGQKKKDEGLYVLLFVLLIVGYYIAKLAIASAIDTVHGPETIVLSIDGFERSAGSQGIRPELFRSAFEVKVGFAASLVSFAFCLFFARDVGYHRRDAMWAAIPSLVAPYFLFKIAWRVANLPGNRYWDMPCDPDPLRVGTAGKHTNNGAEAPAAGGLRAE